ncbi:uncharacterized protein LOC111353867 [Spodoptera litura]|uniref:Uncharacterized protein LOC111353867 n=1 Tax=Spodoptera litura TaxID=69820 RepID=A0A9J7E4G9_SPOLT|nr:uncharacterized protein LOC111353867 [Spodoptera litura]XP_022822834.1 uncharacterized protein LOC111353867 [Spodoptera litura]
MKSFVVFAVVIVSCVAQRSPYAGRLPIGFLTTAGLGNRFGDDVGTSTTIRLPLEALGDVELVRRLSKLPVDNQPFWLLNWKALEENRNRPQTYPQRGNSFIDDTFNANSLQLNNFQGFEKK